MQQVKIFATYETACNFGKSSLKHDTFEAKTTAATKMADVLGS